MYSNGTHAYLNSYRKINDKNRCTIIVSISTQHNKIIRFLELCKSKNFFSSSYPLFLNVTIFFTYSYIITNFTSFYKRSFGSTYFVHLFITFFLNYEKHAPRAFQVIAAVAKVSCKHGLWLVAAVNLKQIL